MTDSKLEIQNSTLGSKTKLAKKEVTEPYSNLILYKEAQKQYNRELRKMVDAATVGKPYAKQGDE